MGTFVALLVRPGQLTRDWLDGRRKRRLPPLAVFAMTSALYFAYGLRRYFEGERAGFESGLRKGWIRTAATASAPDFSHAFDRWVQLQGYGKFASVALLAAAAWLLYRRRGAPSGVPHVIFALHYYAFDYVFFTALAPVWTLATAAHHGALRAAAGTFTLLVGAAYLWRALRVVYGPRRALRNALLLAGADLVFSSLVAVVAMVVAAAQAGFGR